MADQTVEHLIVYRNAIIRNNVVRVGGRAGGRAGVHACGRVCLRACMRVRACRRAGVEGRQRTVSYIELVMLPMAVLWIDCQQPLGLVVV